MDYQYAHAEPNHKPAISVKVPVLFCQTTKQNSIRFWCFHISIKDSEKHFGDLSRRDEAQ